MVHLCLQLFSGELSWSLGFLFGGSFVLALGVHGSVRLLALLQITQLLKRKRKDPRLVFSRMRRSGSTIIASIIKICCPYLLSSRKLYCHDRKPTYLGHIVLEGSPVALGEVGLVTTCRQMRSATTIKVSNVHQASCHLENKNGQSTELGRFTR